MIRLPNFEVSSPETISDLVSLLADGNSKTAILAGGSDLIVNLKNGLEEPEQVIWLGKIGELSRLSFEFGAGLRIGAMCTLHDIAESPLVKQNFPALADTVQTIASPAIRNRATIGGNLCLDTRCYYYNQSEFWRGALGGCLKGNLSNGGSNTHCHAAPGLSLCSAVFCSDLAPLLIAVGASVKLVDPKGERIMLLKDFYREDGVSHLALNHNEILVEVLIPQLRSDLKIGQKKIRSRAAVDFPLANAAVVMEIGDGNICKHVKIVLGAVGSAPVEAQKAASLITGKILTGDLLEAAGDAAAGSVKPLPNTGVTAGYRKKMVKALVERLLKELVKEHKTPRLRRSPLTRGTPMG
ncbi:MAG: FAD binding domain-containing protein [Bacteroidota bacterium]